MAEDRSITKWFGSNLTVLLSEKIKKEYAGFDADSYSQEIKDNCEGLTYTKRVELHSSYLKRYLPDNYKEWRENHGCIKENIHTIFKEVLIKEGKEKWIGTGC